jgi:hypothetical protein
MESVGSYLPIVLGVASNACAAWCWRAIRSCC